jgi:tRNA 2-thiouridine synthesizing protein E
VIAREEGIKLSEEHWEIIHFVQEYYREYSITPIMRILGKAIEKKLGEDKGKSRYLYSLFPDVPIKQSARIAGLPKPPSCI